MADGERISARDRVRRGMSLILKSLLVGLVVSLGALAGLLVTRPTGPERNGSVPKPGRGYWTQPLPAGVPIDSRSEEMIAFLDEDSSTDYVNLSGTRPHGRWGNPIYVAGDGDPSYRIINSCQYPQPPEFRSLRVPRGAKADPTSDGAMTVYDVERGIVSATFRTGYEAADDEWSSCGGAVYYLASNGLEGSLAQSDEPRNKGHRGVPPYTYAVRWDEIEAGAIDHVLKISVNTAGVDHVFPMTGSDGDSHDVAAPPEGARLRLKLSIDLSRLTMTRAERVIATALQKYGAVIGDQSGGPVSLKVENTLAEGRGHLWEGVLERDSLATFTLDDFEVIELGYAGQVD